MSSDLQAAVTPVAISVANLDKCFEIYETPRDRLKQFVFSRLRRMFGLAPKQYFRSYTALKNVSFEIAKGDRVGIIGRNGAGKSTLLQIVCGTLSPTSGAVQMHGRVAALLELGSGFNAEFTGRENIRMNAGVLGLSSAEIDARFEDIVAFADIGDFIDQPVKTYSSGMYIRLAFAVVVHVDAEILIVDEALSVGDMYFQAKCMAHMKKLMETGVTVLFVSHDVGAIKALCNRVIYLDHGEVAFAGNTDAGVEAYYGAGIKKLQGLGRVASRKKMEVDVEQAQHRDLGRAAFLARASFQRLQNGVAELINVQLLDKYGGMVSQIEFGEVLTLRMIFTAHLALPSLGVAYHIRDKNGFDVVYADTGIEQQHVLNIEVGEIVELDWSFSANLREGGYTIAAMLSIPIDLSISKVEVCDFVPISTQITVTRGSMFPMHGAVYWPNDIAVQRFKQTVNPL